MKRKTLRRLIAAEHQQHPDPTVEFRSVTVCFSDRSVSINGRKVTVNGECVTFHVLEGAAVFMASGDLERIA